MTGVEWVESAAVACAVLVAITGALLGLSADRRRKPTELDRQMQKLRDDYQATATVIGLALLPSMRSLTRQTNAFITAYSQSNEGGSAPR